MMLTTHMTCLVVSGWDRMIKRTKKMLILTATHMAVANDGDVSDVSCGVSV